MQQRLAALGFAGNFLPLEVPAPTDLDVEHAVAVFNSAATGVPYKVTRVVDRAFINSPDAPRWKEIPPSPNYQILVPSGEAANTERWATNWAVDVLQTLGGTSPGVQLVRAAPETGAAPGGNLLDLHDGGVQLDFKVLGLQRTQVPFYKTVTVGSTPYIAARKNESDTSGDSHVVRRVSGGIAYTVGLSPTVLYLEDANRDELTRVKDALDDGSQVWIVFPNKPNERHRVTKLDVEHREATVEGIVRVSEKNAKRYHIFYAGPQTGPTSDAVVASPDVTFWQFELTGMAEMLVDNSTAALLPVEYEELVAQVLTTEGEGGAQVYRIFFNDPRTWAVAGVEYAADHWDRYEVSVVPPPTTHVFSEAEKTAIHEELEEIRDRTAALPAKTEFAAPLPLTDGQSLGTMLSVSDTLDGTLVAPMLAYLDSSEMPTVDGLLAAAEIGSPDENGSSVGFRQEGTHLLFDIDLRETITLDLPLDLTFATNSLGLTLAGTSTINVTAGLAFDFTFGIDLAALDTPGEGSFIQVRDLSVSADVDATALNLGVKLGFLEAGIKNGEIHLHPKIAIQFNDPNEDGYITLAELQATPVDELFTLEATGTLDASLPIEASFGGFQATAGITFNDDNLFDLEVPPPQFTGFDELLNFKNLTSHGLFGLLTQLSDWLDSLGDSSVMKTKIPFTDATLGDALDLKNALVEAVLGDLDNQRIVADGPAPADGRLLQDLSFTLTVTRGDQREEKAVSLPTSQTESNTTAAQLVAKLNEALIVAMESGDVLAELQDDQTALVAKTDQITELAVSVAQASGLRR